MKFMTSANINYFGYVDPFRMMQRVIDEAVGRTQSAVGGLMYSEEMTPEQMLLLDYIKTTELAMQARTRNITELYADEDMTTDLRMESYSVPEYLNEIGRQVVEMFPEGMISIEVDCGENCDSVLLDSKRTSIIIYNLLSNAIIHNKKKNKKIVISAFRREETFFLRVADNGKRIEEKDRKRLFSKDAIVYDDIYSGNFGVKGLGLPVCRKIAKEMGGDVFHIPTANGNVFEVTISQKMSGYMMNETRFVMGIYNDAEMYMAEARLKILEKQKPLSE